MSGILNVLGMAVAFAAFYIILVQVNYDLNFNKDIKDSEKIFVMSSGSLDGGDKRQIHFCRQNEAAKRTQAVRRNLPKGVYVIWICRL